MSKSQEHRAARAKLGLSWAAIVGLALLAVPRVVLHDLGVIEEGTFVNALFVFVPALIWVAVAIIGRIADPFVTLLTVGACYGVLLAIGHQILWGVNTGDEPPRLGGNLADLDPGVQDVIIRVFAAFSSIFTGLIVGAVCGLVAWGAASLTARGKRT